MLDDAVCFRATASRDRRFEGRFVMAVRTTGVYCRPGCPAPLPKRRNVAFFAHAAAAEEAGFRPCRRCRPELSPMLRIWPDTTRTVTRAIRLIAEGALDGEAKLEDLGTRLGVGERHLRRLFAKHLGASPVAVAQSRRVHLARRLLDETTLSMTNVALSSGFSSVRRFNDVFRRTFSASPSETRAARRPPRSDGVWLRLPYLPPYDWDSMFAFLSARAIPGVEAAHADVYRRSMEIDGATAAVEVRPAAGESCLSLRVLATFPVDLLQVVERVRRLFDLGCDPEQLARHFRGDRVLGHLVKKRPGLRVAGAANPLEMAVRAILGQQVSVRAACTLAGRLVAAFGTPVAVDLPGITRLFPSASRLAEADLRPIGLTAARAETIRHLARAVAFDPSLLDGSTELEASVARLCKIPGIGAWTAQYIAMRALGEPDAFPAGDLGLKKALSRNGRKPSDGEVMRTAESWRPFRAYAVMHLWRSDG
jgi:AraC family transcriptional regulator, regulatory protein of adaptative response / DNA-3-methyladenine glycosylase II